MGPPGRSLTIFYQLRKKKNFSLSAFLPLHPLSPFTQTAWIPDGAKNPLPLALPEDSQTKIWRPEAPGHQNPFFFRWIVVEGRYAVSDTHNVSLFGMVRL